MLRRITIKNFKGVGENPVEVELKPVTLLFGPNSAGKSTILHALHYTHALLETGNPDVGRTPLGGDLDLGGFKELIHNHNLGAELELGFELESSLDDVLYLTETVMDDAYRSPELLDGVDESERLGVTGDTSAKWRTGVELVVQWSRNQERPIVTECRVSIMGQPFAEVGVSVDGGHCWVTNIDLGHPSLYQGYEGEPKPTPNVLQGRLECAFGRGSALPRRRLYLQDVEAVGGADVAAMIDDQLHRSVSILRGTLERLLYLGPIRAAVPRNYQPPKRPSHARWASGSGAWDALVRSKELREQTSKWLGGEQGMGTSYRVQWSQYREIDEELFARLQSKASNYELDETFVALTVNAPERGRLSVLDEGKDLELAPCDLGEGISQVVPVITAALSDTMITPTGNEEKTELVAIEQPELHIHPRMQVVLGDLFLSQCDQRQFLIETHSEHLMLRLLRRIRETTDNELPQGAPEATVDTVSVLYVDQPDGAVRIRALRVTDDGDFADPWPEGFFSERMRELI